jgi:hypothetical protein
VKITIESTPTIVRIGEASVIGSWRVPRFTPRSITMEGT